ncbi:ubiquitin carboxyl-terminal hydrolase 16/45 [Paragonimus westermani]|uniref:Ubiquitin carboxyl-terminal hydrolase 16/45 n=1 Tax=Paragonimus westermani TaxID=34504 RepID=A0A5J4P2L5_9TREM|nr:ubiquitin carboxyl-terminal hydrolase 16/45 [Paragonimus westermani]
MHITLPIMKASVTTRFYELAGQLREVRSDSFATTLNPGSLREAILERYPRFSGFGQQDSHELLRALLDCMKQEELMRWRKGILDKLNLDMKRKRKHKNPKREQRGKRKEELNDLDVVSSDFDYECPPVAVEDDMTKTNSDVCEFARQDGSVADIPSETSTPNDVYETGGDLKRRFSYEQTGSDVFYEQPQSNEPGGCADAEDSDEDKLGVFTPASHSPPPIEPISYLAEQINELRVDVQGVELFGSDEIIQASRLSQIPLRACVFDGVSHGPNDSSGTLYSCLSRFTAPERLTGPNQIICESCGKGHDNKASGRMFDLSQRDGTHTPVYRDAIRRDLILEAPPLLTVHLKRFQQSACSSVCYRLYGVVEHIGRLAGGHYVAYVAVDPTGSSGSEQPDKLKTLFKQFITPLDHPPKWPLTSHDLVRRLRRCDRTQLLKSASDLSNFPTRESDLDGMMNAINTQSFTEPTEPDDRVWFCCSDSHVTKVSLTTVRNCQPFLLFYERVPS